MKEQSVADLLRQNLRSVKQRYPSITTGAIRILGDLTRALRLPVMLGEILCIEGKWYVTHSGLL
jgi:hypothetical protein